jgi:hypothetical protein
MITTVMQQPISSLIARLRQHFSIQLSIWDQIITELTQPTEINLSRVPHPQNNLGAPFMREAHGWESPKGDRPTHLTPQ